jgi:hypothetical protein
MSMRGYGAITNMKRRFVVMTTVIMTLALGNTRPLLFLFLSAICSRASSVYNKRINHWRLLWQLHSIHSR